jgi:hypothetical protein
LHQILIYTHTKIQYPEQLLYAAGIKIAKSNDTIIGAMDEQGKLTKSGLLYEGNYQEWEDRLWVLLELLDAKLDDPLGALGNGTLVAAYLRSLVIPRLLWIISPPEVTDQHPWRSLLLGLKVAAKPFRLMQLTVDVRTRIWEFTIASQQGRVRYTITAKSPFGTEFLHPVTRVSHEVRAESLGIAWARVGVKFWPSARTMRLYNGDEFTSKYANRFRQLDAFEQTNRVSRVLPVIATFACTGGTSTKSWLKLIVSLSSSDGVNILHTRTRHTWALKSLALHNIQSHFDLASRLFGSSSSSTALAVMALLGAPSLWEQSNLEHEYIWIPAPRKTPYQPIAMP